MKMPGKKTICKIKKTMGHRTLKGAVCKANCFLDAQEHNSILKDGVLSSVLNTKKSQGAIEFIILLGAVLFFFTLFISVVYSRVSEQNREKELVIVKNLALSVQDEIALASKSSNGYSRQFDIPEKISSQDYYISIDDSRIYIKTGRNAVSYPVENATGNIIKGVNLIKRENDWVYIN